MRIGVVFGCAVLTVSLLVFVSRDSPAGVACDCGDADGIVDPLDNCVIVPNGPFLGACSAQEDGDMDGYGVACDTDFNNNGATDAADLGTMLTAVITVSPAVVTDLNCNGAADTTDLGKMIFDTIISRVPGPSGLACAGTIPCS